MTTIALKTTAALAVRPAVATRRRSSLRRVLAHRWDLFAVLGLLGSCTAYAAHALCHLA